MIDKKILINCLNKNNITIKRNNLNLILELFKNPDSFTFEERFNIFRNTKFGDISSKLVFNILKFLNENDLYFKIQEKTY